MIPGIWIGTFFQQKLNKVEVGPDAPIRCVM
jgi:hypothetical protein